MSQASHLILITGSRDWTEADSGRRVIAHTLRSQYLAWGRPSAPALVSGHCPTGADLVAEQIWEGQGFAVDPHPADWTALGRRAGPVRNQQMVDLVAAAARRGALVACLAFPNAPEHSGTSRGTWGCAAMAQRAGIAVRVTYPDGSHHPLGGADPITG